MTPMYVNFRRANLSRIDESASLLSPSDISYDKTEEDLDHESSLRSGRRWKRPSAPILEEESPPGKKQRHRSRSRENRRKSNVCKH